QEEAEQRHQNSIRQKVAEVPVVQAPKPGADGVSGMLSGRQKNLAKSTGVPIYPDTGVPTVAANVVAATDVVAVNAKFRNVGEAVGSSDREAVTRCDLCDQSFSNRLGLPPTQLRVPHRLR